MCLLVRARGSPSAQDLIRQHLEPTPRYLPHALALLARLRGMVLKTLPDVWEWDGQKATVAGASKLGRMIIGAAADVGVVLPGCIHLTKPWSLAMQRHLPQHTAHTQHISFACQYATLPHKK